MPLATLVQWERWICSGSAPEHEVLFIGGILLMAWAGLRFADAQRTCPASLLPDRRVLRSECWRTKVSRSGIRRPWCTSAHCAVGTPEKGGSGPGHRLPRLPRSPQREAPGGGCNTPLRSGTVMMLLWRPLQAPQMQGALMSPEQAWQYTLHSLKATMLSIAKPRRCVRCAGVPAASRPEGRGRFPPTHRSVGPDPFGRASSRARPARHPNGGCTRRRQHIDHADGGNWDARRGSARLATLT